ncbi:MAG: MurR/RpiR family transcriptional regulator [Clostridia bacterium]|nr:MurR/RpiR family transcriptional regulator [Clostridia bacterium]
MPLNIIARIKTDFDSMTKTEKKIADVIIREPSKFVTYSLSDFAKITNASQGSIINFSKKYAAGFLELKLQVSACFGYLEGQKFNLVARKDSFKDGIKKCIQSRNTAFTLTYELNSESTLKKVVKMILKAKRVEIYGIYRSSVVAADFCYQLLQIGIPATVVNDVLACSVSATTLDSKSLVIAISSLGTTKDIINAVKNAKKNNVPIVCITSNANSPLAKLSDEVLLSVSSGNTVTDNALEIRASQILLADTICSYIRSKVCNKEEIFFKTRNILTSHNVAGNEVE